MGKRSEVSGAPDRWWCKNNQSTLGFCINANLMLYWHCLYEMSDLVMQRIYS